MLGAAQGGPGAIGIRLAAFLSLIKYVALLFADLEHVQPAALVKANGSYAAVQVRQPLLGASDRSCTLPIHKST